MGEEGGVEQRSISQAGELPKTRSQQARLIELPAPNGNIIKVYKGLPPILEGNIAEIPYQPHILMVDEVDIYQETEGGKPTRIHLRNQRVLVMHGEVRRNQIYPDYFRSGVGGFSLKEIVGAYEAHTGNKIDVLTVCSYKDTHPTGEENLQRKHAIYRKKPFTGLEDKIQAIYDRVTVALTRKPNGKTLLDLSTESRSRLHIPEAYLAKAATKQ